MKKKYYSSGLFALLLMAGLVLIFLAEPKNSNTKKMNNTEKVTEISIDIIKEVKRKKKITSESIAFPKKEAIRKDLAKKTENNNIGELPPISANYRKYLGFSKYAIEMNRLGAKFFIMGYNYNKMYEIDIQNNILSKVDLGNLKSGNYSSRTRVITDEPVLEKYKKIANIKYKIDNPQVIMLVPKKIEKKLLEELIENKLPLNNVSSLKGYYKLSERGIILCLNEVVIKGKNIMTNIQVKLYRSF